MQDRMRSVNTRPGKPLNFLACIALLAMLLRVVVPAGLMPNEGEGWFLKLCPEGMSAQMMAQLFGHEHHHHDHHSHHTPETTEPTESSYVQCDLGAGLAGEIDLDNDQADNVSLRAERARWQAESAVQIQVAFLTYQARSPPT